jgi:hypothetical protein
MAYTTAEGQQQILDELAAATGQIGVALTALGEAYEHMDEDSGDRLEASLFRPVQGAFGRAKRAHAAFAARKGISASELGQPPAPGLPTTPGASVAQAVEALHHADQTLVELQDSLLPVEVGDQELRAALAEIRGLIEDLPGRARELTRTLGR